MPDSRTHTPTPDEADRVISTLLTHIIMQEHDDVFTSLADAISLIRAYRASHEGLVEALRELVEAKALSKVEELVAGWEGPDKQYARHPANLGARIETTCGRVYDLRDAMAKARRALEAAGITETE